MTAEKLQEIIQKGEDSRIEFKKEISSFDSLRDEMIAFANGLGGEILIGVSDQQEIIGLSQEDIGEYQRRLSNIAHDKIKPSLGIEMANVLVGGKTILCIKVSNTHRPHQSDKGIFWVRQGDSKRKASVEELARLFAKGDLIHIGERPTQALIDKELDKTSFYLYLDKRDSALGSEERQNHSLLLSNLNLAHGECFNVAGLLAFAKNPQKYKPLLGVQCCYFDGLDSSGSEFVDEEDVSGNLEILYKNTMRFIERNLAKKQMSSEFNNNSELEIDPVAIQESLVNALVHRDLYIQSTIKIFLYNDRLEIITPGSLANHLSVEKIKHGTSIIRNQTLHQIAQKILPYSGLGTGIKRILKQEPSVQFENNEEMDTFTTIFNRSGGK